MKILNSSRKNQKFWKLLFLLSFRYKSITKLLHIFTYKQHHQTAQPDTGCHQCLIITFVLVVSVRTQTGCTVEGELSETAQALSIGVALITSYGLNRIGAFETSAIRKQIPAKLTLHTLDSWCTRVDVDDWLALSTVGSALFTDK
jgi:hypothetical protein